MKIQNLPKNICAHQKKTRRNKINFKLNAQDSFIASIDKIQINLKSNKFFANLQLEVFKELVYLMNNLKNNHNLKKINNNNK